MADATEAEGSCSESEDDSHCYCWWECEPCCYCLFDGGGEDCDCERHTEMREGINEN